MSVATQPDLLGETTPTCLQKLPFEPLADKADVVGHRVAERRRMRGLSQKQLAELASCTFNDVVHVERGFGGIRLPLVMRLAVVLYTEPQYLLRGTGDRNGAPSKAIDFLYEGTPLCMKVREFAARQRLRYIADGNWE